MVVPNSILPAYESGVGVTYEQFIELRAALTALWSESPEANLEALFAGAVVESHRALMPSGYKDAVNDYAAVAPRRRTGG